MIIRRLLPLFLLPGLGVAAVRTPPAHRTAAPKTTLTDPELERTIRERFARSKCAGDHFTVRVQGGVATIEGKTAVIQRKGAATRMARSAGARQVVNRIQVDEQALQKASANLAKGRRRVQVKRGEARSSQ